MKNAAILVAVILALVAGVYAVKSQKNLGQATPGLESVVATSSQLAITPTATLAFATSTCTSRIITTTANPIVIGFSDLQGIIPTNIGGSGHMQLASTTVVYDSGVYGCKAWRIAGQGATQIFLTETR